MAPSRIALLRNLAFGSPRVKSPARARSTFRPFPPLAVALLLSACATCPESHFAQLYFGRALPGGGEIDEATWTSFVDTELTPRFPEGLTVLDATGQWRDPRSGRIDREKTKLVQIAAPPSDETRRKIEEIRAAYRSRFGQGSVGLVTAPACAEF
jgi:hypothetical protein